MSHSPTEASVTRDFWPKLKKSLARIPFAEDMLAAFYCAVDPATPLKAKGILLAALAYFIMPFDVIPDFILGLGFTDDMAVLYAAISMIRSNITQGHRGKAKETLEKLKAETVESV
jgi:uncharacterized membrane protein YkvA (DUF1232 family)